MTIRLGKTISTSCTRKVLTLKKEGFTDPTNSVSYLSHEEVAIDKIINHRITKSEVKKAIKKLKNGKSAGEDNIINEVLKTGEFCLVDPIVKLLNLILQ